MTFLIKPITAPITDITAPLYHLMRGDSPRQKELERLFLATFRTATVAGLFFVIIPFNRIFGHQDNLSGSFTFASQWIIHPYAAALFNAFMNGGILLVFKTVDVVTKRQFILTRNDVGGFARAFSFLCLAQFLKTSMSRDHYVDRKYQRWSHYLACTFTNKQTI